jgi:hypothetical protein
MITHKELREHLNGYVRGCKVLAAAHNHRGSCVIEDFILRVGIDCIAQPLPKGIKRGTPKMCFYNSYQLVRRRKYLRFCEGVVLSHKLPIAIHHAWAIDAENRVVDCTLGDPTQYTYIGVPIDTTEVRGRPSCSMFLDYVGRINLEWMRARCPTLLQAELV